MNERLEHGPYWLGTRVLVLSVLIIFFVCLVTALIFVPAMGSYELFGFPVGYLIVSKGLIILAAGLVFWFIDRQDRLDHKHRMIEDI